MTLNKQMSYMPTKEEVKRAYRNIKLALEWRKRPLTDKLLDRLLEIQKWLGDYLDESDYEL